MPRFLYLSLLISFSPTFHAICPAGYTEGRIQNYCYKFIGQPNSFTNAEAKCEEAPNGHLASVSDAFSNAFFNSIANEVFPRSIDVIWLGGYNQSKWTWTDGTNFAYQNWAKGQPGTGQCLNMQLSDGTWDSMDCNTELPYVCEIPSSDSGNTCPTQSPVVGTTISPIQACDSEWTYFNATQSCYKVFHNQDWTSAEQTCVQNNAHLVSIHSWAENGFVFQISTAQTTMTCECANCDSSCEACGNCNTGASCGLFYAYSCNTCNGCGYCDCSCNNWCVQTCGGQQHVWIGLQNPSGDGVYTWSDGTPFDYETWSNSYPKDQSSNRCVVLVADKDTSYDESYYKNWVNIPCSTTARAFVCKKSVNK